MQTSIHAQTITLGFAILFAVPSKAESIASPPTVHDVATVAGYWRLLAVDGDRIYIAHQGQCPQELSLPMGTLRSIVARCLSGETWQFVVGGRNFYWTQASATGGGSGRTPRVLFACQRDHCVPRRVDLGRAYSVDDLHPWKGGVMVSLSRQSLSVKGATPSVLAVVDDESGKVQSLAKTTSRIVSFAADETDVYYHLDDQSNAIWRKALSGPSSPEPFIQDVNDSQMLSLKSAEKAFELDRSRLLGLPRVHDFERIVEVDEQRVYWQTRLLHWHAKVGPAVGLIADDVGVPLSVFGHVVSDGQHVYFTNSHLTLIQGVSKRTGRVRALVMGQAGIASFLVAQRRLIWSTYSREKDATSIHWAEAPAGE